MRFIFLLLFIPSLVSAQTFQKEKLDSLLSRLDRNGKFMGSLVLYKDGALLYQQTIGYVDSIGGRKSDIHTKYRIGSITKTFTAVLVMKAMEQGKLSLDDKLSRWFPEVEKSDSISIRQMLCHRSGIANFTDAKDYLGWNTKPQTKEQILEKIIKGGNRFSPGSSFEYSNSGYFLLGLILEKVNKISYAELIRRQILKPLRLTETSIGSTIDPAQNECRSFIFTGLWLRSPETDMSVTFSAGNIISTPADICRFAQHLFEGKLISKNALVQMQEFKDNVGLGLFQFPYGMKQASGHTGGIDGFSTVYGYFPDGKVYFALFSNGTNYNNNDITIALLSAAYGDEVNVPDFSVKKMTNEDLQPYLGVYTSKQIPLKLTFTASNGNLISQATGQAAFQLDALGNHVFTKDQYGIRLTFDPSHKKLLLSQGGANLIFEKE
ncbi:MAG: serine hydrolase domain-containing protein [Sphingobacteriales bacterium]|jgi:D-alanyl-D-alanine carboxypeptidase